MKAHRKCPRCEADLVLVEDENRTSVGQVEDRHTVKSWIETVRAEESLAAVHHAYSPPPGNLFLLTQF